MENHIRKKSSLMVSYGCFYKRRLYVNKQPYSYLRE
ncbi:hypothetical protein SPAB_04890 [Salmonella enterica subsp. enterica serovar Paratyphi B str. SPB7]|uniref:Uncharacterized protein n=1 Tax=Salmonella paratyphi B (strain ATCC BAA-1250 / SPB7) TaxID=1016998 RepID=A0A6C6Z963_SALPB|nr:hypothetical protein SPAB_04890 [Salmonella enterica subsp. enterica serovar Paratyphi B str. SPB7]